MRESRWSGYATDNTFSKAMGKFSTSSADSIKSGAFANISSKVNCLYTRDTSRFQYMPNIVRPFSIK